MVVSETIRPEDVLVGLLAEVRHRKGDRFRADPVTVHSRFYEWRENPEFSDLFRDFLFDSRIIVLLHYCVISASNVLTPSERSEGARVALI